MGRRARLLDQEDDAGPGALPGIVVFALHPFLLHQLRVQVEQFDEVIAAARQPWPDKFNAFHALPADNAQRVARNPIRALLTGPVPNLAVLSQSPIPAGLNLAVRRVAVATLAVERYRRAHGGTLPSTLGDTVPAFMPSVPIDPFSGRPLIYKPATDGYLLYSVDANGVDNGGQLYGLGAMSTMANPKTRDFGIKVSLAPRPVRQ
jgi:hypothetical protein